MNSAEQAAGEKRVMETLVEPLKRRGLAKPSTLTVAGFEEMVQDMCARLAYMSEASLAALEEQVAANPGGKDRNRFPIANLILSWAADIQPPGDGASPLIRAVFAHQIGRAALEEGWAPELLFELRKTRRWPGSWSLKTIKDGAGDAVRKLRDFETRLARGDELLPAERDWRDRRVAALQRCRDIEALITREVS
jgi:hypothetical protein